MLIFYELSCLFLSCQWTLHCSVYLYLWIKLHHLPNLFLGDKFEMHHKRFGSGSESVIRGRPSVIQLNPMFQHPTIQGIFKYIKRGQKLSIRTYIHYIKVVSCDLVWPMKNMGLHNEVLKD